MNYQYVKGNALTNIISKHVNRKFKKRNSLEHNNWSYAVPVPSSDLATGVACWNPGLSALSAEFMAASHIPCMSLNIFIVNM